MGIDASVPPCNMRPGRRERRWLCALLAFVYMADRTVVYACGGMYQAQYMRLLLAWTRLHAMCGVIAVAARAFHAFYSMFLLRFGCAAQCLIG